jgi:hypothetical protein
LRTAAWRNDSEPRCCPTWPSPNWSRLWHCRLEFLTSQVELGGPPPQVGAIAGPRPRRGPAPGVDAAMPNELIGPREHNWLTSKVLSTAVRAYSTGSVTLRTGHPTLIERVCAGQRGMVGAGGVEPPSSSVSAKCKEPLCGRSFSQVAPDRRGRSYMLSQRSVKWLFAMKRGEVPLTTP